MYPILFHLGPLTAHAYGTLIFLGIVAGLLVGRAECRRVGLDPQVASEVVLGGIVAGVLGGKVLFLLTVAPQELARNPALLTDLGQGLVWYGVLAANLLWVAAYARLLRLRPLLLIDGGIPCLVLGHAIGRLGCFLAGCCWGRPTDLPWAVTFRDPRSLAPIGIPLHPTQLYLSLHSLAVFALLWRWRRRKRYDGEVLLVAMVAYGLGRLPIEWLRGDVSRALGTGPAISEWVSVAAALSAAALLVLRRRRERAA
jgi:phosphatidylglycerol:prolipoprotein diacylglycerol transferase